MPSLASSIIFIRLHLTIKRALVISPFISSAIVYCCSVAVLALLYALTCYSTYIRTGINVSLQLSSGTVDEKSEQTMACQASKVTPAPQRQATDSLRALMLRVPWVTLNLALTLNLAHIVGSPA